MPSRDATGRLRPRATDPAAVGVPSDVPPVMDGACTASVAAIATHLFNRARDPPPPPPGLVAPPESMSMRQCIDAAQLLENAEGFLSDVLAFRNQFPALTTNLSGTPPVHDLSSLGPLLLQIAGVALRQSTRLIAAVCAAAEALGETFVHDLDNELATCVAGHLGGGGGRRGKSGQE